jgi:preprotein translocase SecF subunit
MKFPLSIVPDKVNIGFIKWHKLAFVFSAVITIMTLGSLWAFGLNQGIDFAGGIVVELQSDKAVDIILLREAINKSGYVGASLQELPGENALKLRLKPKTSNFDEEIGRLNGIIKAVDANIIFRKMDFVGPKVGDELVVRCIYATFVALIAMMVYIGLRFNWQFGIGAIVALLHDAIITLGFFIIMGYEFDLTSVAAVLTIVGYSINDTVVIYDRIRDNLQRHKRMPLAELLNLSINETLSRTVMTVLTTVVVCISLVLFGGESLRSFSAAILFGILFGTYSSIYISAPMLLYTKIR